MKWIELFQQIEKLNNEVEIQPFASTIKEIPETFEQAIDQYRQRKINTSLSPQFSKDVADKIFFVDPIFFDGLDFGDAYRGWQNPKNFNSHKQYTFHINNKMMYMKEKMEQIGGNKTLYAVKIISPTFELISPINLPKISNIDTSQMLGMGPGAIKEDDASALYPWWKNKIKNERLAKKANILSSLEKSSETKPNKVTDFCKFYNINDSYKKQIKNFRHNFLKEYGEKLDLFLMAIYYLTFEEIVRNKSKKMMMYSKNHEFIEKYFHVIQ